MVKTVKFDSFGVGAEFTFVIGDVEVPMRKVTADYGQRLDTGDRVKVTRKSDVKITLPDPPPPTPEQELAYRLAQLQRWLQWDLESCDKDLGAFRRRLDENEAYAFEWGDGAVQSAAIKKVVLIIKDHLEYEPTAEQLEEKGADFFSLEARLDRITKDAVKNALRGAESPSRSTGQCHNLVQQYLTAAWAKYAQRLTGQGW